jgi:hypothetical protein
VKLNDLQDGQVVRARWGRAGTEAPAWGIWQNVELFVQRYQDRVAIIGLKNVAWAEYGTRDLCRPDVSSTNAHFLVEDYFLEVEGLEP